MMDHVTVANSQLDTKTLHRHVHVDTHARMHTCIGIEQLHALSPPKRPSSPWTLHVGHTSPPVVLLMKTRSERFPSRTAYRSGSELRGGLPCAGACSPPGTASPAVEGKRAAFCVLPVKSVTGVFVTLFSKSERRCKRRMRAAGCMRCALETVRGSLQYIPNSNRHFVRSIGDDSISEKLQKIITN